MSVAQHPSTRAFRASCGKAAHLESSCSYTYRLVSLQPQSQTKISQGMNLENLASMWTSEHQQTGSCSDRTDKLRMVDVDVGHSFSFLWVLNVRRNSGWENRTYCGLDHSTIERLAGVDRDICQTFQVKSRSKRTSKPVVVIMQDSCCGVCSVHMRPSKRSALLSCSGPILQRLQNLSSTEGACYSWVKGYAVDVYSLCRL